MMKKIRFNNNCIKTILYIIVGVFFIFLIHKVSFLNRILSIILICFIFSYMLKPIYMYLVNKKINKRFSAILILSGFTLLFIISIAMIVPKIVNESYKFAEILSQVQQYIEDIQGKTDGISSNPNLKLIIDKLGEKINCLSINILEKCLNSLHKIGENIVLYLTAPMIMYYFLCEGEKIKNKMLIIFAGKKRKIISEVLRDVDKVLKKYILSQFILCVIVSILTYISLKLLKVEFAFMLAIINGILNIIPYFGAPIGMILTFLISIISSDVNWILVMVSLIVVQNIESNLISPFLIGKSVHMHPLSVIILLIVGQELIGVVGIIIAIPIGVVLKMVYEDINYYLY